jgi:hypothetical protein
MQYYWCSIILFSFSSFSKFHRVVPLLQACLFFVCPNLSFCPFTGTTWHGKHQHRGLRTLPEPQDSSWPQACIPSNTNEKSLQTNEVS